MCWTGASLEKIGVANKRPSPLGDKTWSDSDLLSCGRVGALYQQEERKHQFERKWS